MSKDLMKGGLSVMIVILVVGILLGGVITLSFRYLKYSSFITPHIVEIDPKSAYKNIVSNPKKIILIDVRSEGEYSLAHASSSVNLPIHYLYDDTHGLKNELGIPLPKNTDQEIYLLCTGGRLAGVAYSYLEHYGYRNIRRIEGGLSNWNNQGLPVITKSLFGLPHKESRNLIIPTLDKPYENKIP